MKKGLKIIVDIIMTVGLLLLMSLATTGILLHEVLGLGIFILFVFHKYLNRSWIVSVSKAIFRKHAVKRTVDNRPYSNGVSGKGAAKKVNLKAKGFYFLDVVILLFVTAATVTGILISQVLLPGLLTTQAIDFWTPIHFSASYGTLILISIHIGFHWNYIMQAFRKMFDLGEGNPARTWAMRTIAIGLILMGVRFSATKQVGLTLVTPFLPSKESETQTYIQTISQIESPKYLATQTTATDSITLEEFLGKTICTLCGKHCSLLRPRCSRGVRKAQEATIQFNAAHSNSITGSTSSQADSKASSSKSTSVTSSKTVSNSSSKTASGATSSNATSSSTGSSGKVSSYSTSSIDSSETVSPGTSDSSSTSLESSSGLSTPSPVEDSSLPFIPIMSIYIAGTHYAVSLTEKLKKTKSHL